MTPDRRPSTCSSTTTDEEHRLWLPDKDNGYLSSSQEPGSCSAKLYTWTRLYIFALHAAIIALTTLLLSTSSKAPLSLTPTGRQTWSPAQNCVEYEVNGEHALHNGYSKYSGPPTVEQDKAWDDLIRPVYFRATEEEMRRGGETLDSSVELEGGGYLAAIGVYHELHCIRQLRLQLFKQRYYPNLTEPQDKYLHGHLDHCLESLRLTIMCHGNTALYSFAWSDTASRMPVNTKSNSKSVCAKWSAIENWAHTRMVPTNPALRHP